MGAVDTTYTFTATDTITSAKMNNIIDQTTITSDAIVGTTLEVASGKLKIRAAGITANEIAAGEITPALTNFANSLLPAGAVMAFAMTTAPAGWLAANGASVSTTTYASLFAAIGYTYGGSGGSFNLPDLRGYFVRGHGTNGDGTASAGFGEKQADELKSHNHLMYLHPGTGTGGNTGAARFGDLGLGSSTTQSTGGNETRPKNIAMLYCIKT